MKRNVPLCFVLSLCMMSELNAQKIATLTVELANASFSVPVVVQVELDPITSLGGDGVDMLFVEGEKQTPVAFQVLKEEVRRLIWIIEPLHGKQSKLTYELVASSKHSRDFQIVSSTRENGSLSIRFDKRNLVRYQFEKLNPPSGVDTIYARSGFIHPLWSPKGQVLTRVQAPDHYHHYGIWNPWTHVLYEGDTIDFWNLNKKEGTVRFAEFLSTSDGPVFSEFKALHEHVVFRKNGTEEIALNEIQTVKVFRPWDENVFIMDITSELSCANTSAFKILEYRYGGLGWRTTEKWDRYNSEVITSEGKTRKEADGSTARWCIIQGSFGTEYAGAVMLSHPSNYNHPEPLRIWPENQYDRGDMFVNFSPTKFKDWLLEPGKTYTLRYRFIVFNGKFSKQQADIAWEDFANPTRVTVKK